MSQLPVNSTVKVEWQETSSTFTGTIQSANSDGTYDVVYDEKIDGKKCIEKFVARERIEIEQQQIPVVSDDYWMDEDDMNDALVQVSPARTRKPKHTVEDDKIQSDDEDDAVQPTTQRSKLISKLLAVRTVSNDGDQGVHMTEQASADTELAALSNRDVITLHDLLTPAKASELLNQETQAAGQINSLVSLLVANLNHNCAENTASSSFAESWADFAGESSSKQPHLDWLHQLTSAEDSALSALLAINASLAALLRLQAGHAHSQSQDQKQSLFRPLLGSASATLSIPEESLERALRSANSFLNVNFLSNALTQNTKSTGAASGKAAKGKGKESFQSKAMSELARVVFPTLSSVLAALEEALSASKQSERLCSTAAELALTVLRCDPTCAPALEVLQVQSSTVLASLHRTASSLLREVFATYPSQRKTLVVELLSQLAQSFAVKSPYKSYALHYGVHQEGTRYTSVTFITLLSCLQSVVDVRECLTEDKTVKSPQPALETAHASNNNSKAKGKKGSKKVEEAAPAEVFTDEYTKKDDRAGSVEAARKSVLQNYVCCATFVSELFQRCLHKEVSGDYRTLAGCLISELLSVIPLPAWPVAAILLEQMMVHVLKQLSAEAEQNTKRDAAYTTFLLDLLGAACVGMRSITVTAEREQSAAATFRLSAAVQEGLEKKLARLEPTWLSAVKPSALQSPSAGATSAKKFSKAPSKSKVSSDELYLDTLPSPAGQGKLVAGAALDALQEISSSAIDVIAELPRHAEDNSTSASALPTPLEILRQLPGQEALVSLFPDISPLDLQYHHVSTHLARACAAHSGASGVCGGSAARDAYAACIALWYINAISEDRRDVAAHIQGLLQELSEQMKGSSRLETSGKSPFKSPSSSAQRGFHDIDHAARGNYSMEAILAANRVILTARSLSTMFEHVLDAILALSVEPVPAIRSKVIKVLSPLLQADNDLIQRDNIRFAITNRLLDRNISVREESVKLLGFYVVRGYERLAQPYLEGLKERLHDEGISVRKSVVLLFKEILLNQPNHPQYTELCLSLLEKASHPKEEESIREIVRATFQQIWFLPPSASAVQTNLRLKLASQTSSQSLQSAGQSCNSLTQQFSGVSTASQDAVTPRTPSEHVRSDPPGLSRAPSFQLDGVMLDNTVSPLSQAGPQAVLSDAMISPAELTLDTRAEVLGPADSSALPAVSTGKTTPSARHTDVPNSAFSVHSAQSAQSARSSLPGGLNSPKEALKDHIRSTALQLVEMAAMDEANDWMISLLREMLHGTSEGDEVAAQLKQRRAGSFKYCEQIVTCLVELLLCTEERQPEIMQLLAARGREPKIQAMNIIRTVAMFCNAHPPFIAKHLRTLLPYLKHDNSYTKEQNALIKLKVTEIISSTALLDTSAFSFDVSEVVADLKKCALNLSGKNIKAAINCLAVLAANVTKDASPLYQLADVCFKGIRSIATACVDNALLTPLHIGNLQRCLIVFGYVCECAKKCSDGISALAQRFNTSATMANASSAVRKMYASPQANQGVAMKDIAEVEFLHPATMHGACYAAAIYALTVPSAAVQIRGAQALCGVFAGCPRLMMLAQEEGLLSALLGESYDDQVHERFIVALKDMMIVEEERLESQQALRQMKDSGVAVVEKGVVMGNLEQDSEATIPGFTLQQHFPELIGFLAHKSASLRFATLTLVGTLLRQGMVCSLDVLASLIALQGDCDAKIRDEALTMLQIEDERHPTFMGNRMVDGVELCYSFQLKAIGSTIIVEEKSTPSDHRDGQKCSVFGSFFSSCIAHPKRRKEFLDGLLSRSYLLITKLREQLAQHPSSFDAILQALAAQQKLLREEQAAAAMATEETSETTGTTTQAVTQVPSKLTRKPSFPSTSASSSLALSKGDFSLHVQNVKEAFARSGASDFIAATLAYLPYDVPEEPLQLIYFINRNVTVGASLLLHRLKQQVLAMGGELRKAGGMQPPVLGTKPRGAGSSARSGPTTPTTPGTASRSAPGSGSGSGDGSISNIAAITSAMGPLEGDVDLLVNEEAFHAWLHATLSGNTDGPTSGAALVVTRICELVMIAQELRCNEAVLRLKSFIKLAYGITDDRCASFNPDDRSAAATSSSNTIDKLAMVHPHMTFQPHSAGTAHLSDIFSTQQLSALATNAAAFCRDPAGAGALLGTMRQIAMDYNRITLLLNNDPEDFTLTAGSTAGTAVGAKRKRKTATGTPSTATAGTNGATPGKVVKRGRPAKAAAGAAGSAEGKAGAKKGKKKARRSSFALRSSDEESGEEEDLDHDDEWSE